MTGTDLTQVFSGATSVYDAFARAVQRTPDRPMLNCLPATAQLYGISPGELSYGEVQDQVDRVAAMFVQAGYGARMRVALLLENRPAFFIYWLALNKIGASVVPVNPDLRQAELEYLIGHAEPALIVTIPQQRTALEQAARAVRIALTVICEGTEPPPPRPNATVAEDRPATAREAAILYTSGTTGNPKGCVLPNSYFLLAGGWYATVGGLATLRSEGERMITPLPVFHMNAMAYSFMAMVAVGGCLTVLDRFHPRSWWQDVTDARASCLHYLGVMPSMLLGLPEMPQDTAHQVRFGFGAGVDPKKQVQFESRFGFPLVEAWAMTETGAGAVIAASSLDRLIGQASIGKPAGDIACLLVDEAGDPVPQGHPGELLVRRANGDPRYGFFSHYYKDAAATEAAWENGWFHTGDVVRQDADGNMYFVDRKKNVIRRSGENIAAVEVESILMRHPAISAAAVTAVPDELRGDEVLACLVCTAPAAAKDIALWCLDQMAYYKVPGYIAFVAELPLTATQKIQRAALKDLAQKLVHDPATENVTNLKKRQGV